ncbi:ABC transporter permease [Curtobacterium herbarum]|uniref:ABC transporter permease n=1 Tax=Curtobacterium herbarum TaxID=150122 RepID=A0ABP4K8N0_9MICO|nr:ABC transporter permease [Curtobacterium herbarum]MBM7476913.1 peptide/nickel transport system permease protein [Curtobacterium herbarum]MCS6545077.1 ABC transporter permease [Curtobacterium herbarum]
MSAAVVAPRWTLRPTSGVHAGRRTAQVLVGLLVALTVLALVARLIAPDDPIQPVATAQLPIGTPGHLFGTDSIGRDVLSRTLFGLQTSWLSALAVVAVGLVVGGVVGATAGVAGGWVDSVLMRVTDLFLALPSTLVAIAIVAALGPGLTNTLVGISVVWWPYYARIIRSEVRATVTRPHVEAARLAGVGRARLVLRHVLPGAVPTAIVTASLDIGNVVLLLAGLSFLGLGQPAPAAELGADTGANTQLLLSAWWVPVVPGAAVLLLSLVSNLAGDGVRTLIARR